MKKLNLFVAAFLAMITAIVSVNAEAGDTKPEYVTKESGLFVCTVDTNEEFVEATTVSWKNNNGKDKNCDIIRIASETTITISSEVNIGDKILEIGDDDDASVETLIVTAGGKLIVGQDGAVSASQNSVIEVSDGGIIDSQSSLNLYGKKGTSRVTVKGDGSEIKIHKTSGLEEYAIDDFATVEVLDGGKINITDAQGGINANNINVTDATVEITGTHVDDADELSEMTAGINGVLVTSGNAKLILTGNDIGLALKAGSSIGGNTVADVTGNTTAGIVLKGTEEGSMATIVDNASVTTTDVKLNGKKVKLQLVVDSTDAEFTYTSEENQDYVVLKNGYITDNATGSDINHVLYADHDVTLEQNETVKNTADTAIKVTARDSKNSQTLEAGTKADYQVIKVTIGEEDLILFVNEKLADLNEAGAKKLEEFKTPQEGYTFDGLVNANDETMDENVALTEDVVLTAKFTKIPVVEEPAPNTYDAGLALVGLAVLGLGATVVTVRKLRNN